MTIKSVEQVDFSVYTAVVRKDDEGDFVAHVEELPGCVAHGSTRAEALERLDEAMKLWVEDALDAGDEIPVPSQEEELPSGKWLQRSTRSLHQKLIRLAKIENVSLNSFVNSVLAEAAGVRETKIERKTEIKDVVTEALLALRTIDSGQCWMPARHPAQQVPVFWDYVGYLEAPQPFTGNVRALVKTINNAIPATFEIDPSVLIATYANEEEKERSQSKR